MHIYLTNEWYMTVKTRAQWTPIRPTCSFYDPASRCYQSWGAAIACKSPEGQCFFWTNILPDWTDFCSHFSSNHSGLTPADPGSHSPLDSMERPTEPFAGYHGHGWGERLNKFKDQIAWKWISRRYIYSSKNTQDFRFIEHYAGYGELTNTIREEHGAAARLDLAYHRGHDILTAPGFA